MRKTRRSQGSTLAFLDVMACGLGVAILLFLIVKHNTGAVEDQSSQVESDANQVELLSQLEEHESQLSRELELARQAESAARNESRRLDELEKKQNQLAILQSQLESERVRKTRLQDEIVSIQPRQAADVLENSQVGEEKYLLGLEVKGRNIAILIDRSASMTDNLLVDIISRKVRSDTIKKQGPKWKRTVRTAKWLLNRVPEDSNVIVVAFNDQAQILNEGRWAKGRDSESLQGIVDELAQLVPTGATNLESALRELKSASPFASDLYVITDGLPTQSLSRPVLFSSCRNRSNTVSGSCRKAYFHSSLVVVPESGTVVNVILLPLEGDPEAAPEYWSWAAVTGGTMLVPAENWP
ncbi:MAG: VWA domain-containing protein [Acidiferrobacterales bacterium]|nr:VWA domain-containing protein [Acidiferrobacterales bacterium]